MRLESRDRGTIFPFMGTKFDMLTEDPAGMSGHASFNCTPEERGTSLVV